MIGSFIVVGFEHIVSLDALDHILFLVVLAACYRPRDWRHGVIVATAFTIGHSITLALASLGLVTFPTAIVEFLIPCTIVAAALENLRHLGERPGGRARPALALVFGLIHGAGFANTLRELFDGGIAVPLLGFNIGIELGQLLVLSILVTALAALEGGLRVASQRRAMQLRVSIPSVAAAVTAVVIAAGRLPW